jgi:hypothetical protein
VRPEPVRERRGRLMVDQAPLLQRALRHMIDMDDEAAALRETREVIEVLQASRSADSTRAT